MPSDDASISPPAWVDPPAWASPPVVAIAGWLVPGLGYGLIGQRARAWFSGVAIVALFVLGLLIAGVRCVDVPGYDSTGELRRVQSRGPMLERPTVLASDPVHSILDKPWFIPQVCTGPVALAAGAWSVKVSPSYRQATGRLWDIGTLYTAVAGILNLLALLDAAARAARHRAEVERADAAWGSP